MNRSTALLTDRYELTMLDAALRSGQATKRSVFELFTRGLPEHRGYGVVAGTARALDAIGRFTFADDELSWLADNKVISPDALTYLSTYRFTGDIWGYREGDLYGANSPVLTVEAPFAEAVVLETVLLSIFNHDAAVASAVARMVDAADGRAVIEGGARRGHEIGSVDAARAAYLAGAAATSNLEAGRAYGIPTIGTIGHAFILAHNSEEQAFNAQHDLLGSDTTYLVDTYDIPAGIRAAVAVAGPNLGGIRIDSGDLAVESANARRLLDELGASGARIIVSGDLDEWSIRDLADAPIDGYLVGTNLITGSGHPTASMIYKLVAIEADGRLHSVNKRSSGKGTTGGRKAAFRMDDHDLLVVNNEATPDAVPTPDGGRRLQVRLIEHGEPVSPLATLDEARDWCRDCVAALDAQARSLDGTPLGSITKVEAD
ncbi:MAG: nicotinate phosphoribosyltransferase [Actinomycetota bacterium]